ncbi:hypothetical protein [Rubrolithibacter danxiaensis]|uniref:hypothetical protein n=1 Tax=Rubrolithibacter danxiaensis TaxID=3390805 RepID=UPI003BF772FA
MSTQSALKLIQILRQNKSAIKSLMTLQDIAELSEEYQLPCTEEELRIAFCADWKMRWLKFCNQDSEK